MATTPISDSSLHRATPRHSAVVGAGMVGLVMAFRLREAGHDVTLIERSEHVGGLVSSHTVGPIAWDQHYHVTLASDSAWRSILKELNLDESIVWKTTRTACLADGTLLPVSSPQEFLRFSPISLIDRLRLGGTLFWATLVKDGRKLEQVPVEKWLRRLSGNSAFDRFWRPLLRAKLGTAYTEASAAFIWATAQRLGKARKNGLDAEKFGYVPGGYANTLRVFADRLRADGVDIKTGIEITSISTGSIRLSDGSIISADDIIVTASTKVARRLIVDLNPTEQALLDQVQYQGVIDVSLVLPKQLCDYYLTYLLDDTILTGVVDMSSLVEASELRGHGLVYLPRYAAPDDPLFDLDDEAIVARFTADLARVYPEFDPASIVASRVAKVREVFSVPTIGYSDRVLPFATSVPGVWIANSAQIVNGTLNVDESVQLAERATRSMLASIRETRRVPTIVKSAVPSEAEAS